MPLQPRWYGRVSNAARRRENDYGMVCGDVGGGIMPVTNRWSMALAGVCLQMALGAAYAWSVFRIPLAKQFGWTISQITSTFLISWFFLGCAAVMGGLWMKRSHPRVVAMTAGL